MANPIDSADSIFTEFIPITSPFGFINGPPLFPGFIVASVCIKSSIYETLSFSSIFIVLSTALIIPPVTVLLNSKPIGFPIAYTFSPILILSESPNITYGRLLAFIFITDKSKSESDHTTFAKYSLPFSNVT